MASKQNNTVKVPQSVIDDIKKLGMAAAIKKAKSGNASREFVEGVRRFYPKAVEGVDELSAKRATKGIGVDARKQGPKETVKKEEPPTSAVARRFASTSSPSPSKKKDDRVIKPHRSGRGYEVDLSPGTTGVKGIDDKAKELLKKADSDIVKPHRSGRGTEVDLSPGNKGIKGLDDYLIRNVKGAAKAVAKGGKAVGKAIKENTGTNLPSTSDRTREEEIVKRLQKAKAGSKSRR